MNLQELSLLNIGFIVNGNYNPAVYDSNKFPPPYNKAIKLLQENPNTLKDKTETDKLLTSVLMLQEIETAHEVAARQNGLGEFGAFDWVGAQSQAYEKWQVGTMLERVSKDLRANNPVDVLPVFGTLQTMVVGNGKSGLIPANEIDETHYIPYMKCGYKPIDDIIGGIPSDGPIITLGWQGVGKSYWLFMMVCSWLTANPDKTAAIYTLEMPAEHYKWRSLKMYRQFEDVVNSGRLRISGSVKDVNELTAEVSASQVGLVGIDDMDGLVADESPSAYQAVYRKIKEICRFLGIPVIVLAQPNREAKKAKRFLGIYDAAWSGAAENSAAMFLTLNFVDPLDGDWQDKRFPINEGNSVTHPTPRLFMCFWKFRESREEGFSQGVGAIRIEPDPTTGYYKQIWVGDAYKNKLFSPVFVQDNQLGAKPAGNRRVASSSSIMGDD